MYIRNVAHWRPLKLWTSADKCTNTNKKEREKGKTRATKIIHQKTKFKKKKLEKPRRRRRQKNDKYQEKKKEKINK